MFGGDVAYGAVSENNPFAIPPKAKKHLKGFVLFSGKDSSRKKPDWTERTSVESKIRVRRDVDRVYAEP
jgi:hypothetical protein